MIRGIEAEYQTVENDKKIDEVTKTIVNSVDGADSFDIWTCSVICGELVIVSNYDIPDDVYSKLKKKAMEFDYSRFNTNIKKKAKHLKFFWNGIKTSEKGAKLQKAYIRINKGVVSVSAKEYEHFSNEVTKEFNVKNDTDGMSDYFDKDRFVIKYDSPYYDDALKAIKKGAERHIKMNAKAMVTAKGYRVKSLEDHTEMQKDIIKEVEHILNGDFKQQQKYLNKKLKEALWNAIFKDGKLILTQELTVSETEAFTEMLNEQGIAYRKEMEYVLYPEAMTKEEQETKAEKEVNLIIEKLKIFAKEKQDKEENPLFKKRVIVEKEQLPNGTIMEIFAKNIGDYGNIYTNNNRYYYYNFRQFRTFPIGKKKLKELGVDVP